LHPLHKRLQGHGASHSRHFLALPEHH